jgi:hypothetical protein
MRLKASKCFDALRIVKAGTISIPDPEGQGVLVHEGVTPRTFVRFGPFLDPMKGRVRAARLIFNPLEASIPRVSKAIQG